MGRGFEKFVDGIGQGYGLGKQVGDDIQKGRSKRGVAKYGDELDAWMESDPLATTEGIPTEGGAQGPTTRDLLGIQSDYRKYAEMSNEPGAMERADKQWAEKLHNGATSALGKAGELIGKGDHEAAAKWIDRAGSFIPNGLAYKTTMGEDGKLMVSSYDESTGQMTEQRPATQQDIVQMSATLGDANKATAFMAQAMAQGAAARKERVEEAMAERKLDQTDTKIAETNRSNIEKERIAGQNAKTASRGVTIEEHMLPFKMGSELTGQELKQAQIKQANGLAEYYKANAAGKGAVGGPSVGQQNVDFKVSQAVTDYVNNRADSAELRNDPVRRELYALPGVRDVITSMTHTLQGNQAGKPVSESNRKAEEIYMAAMKGDEEAMKLFEEITKRQGSPTGIPVQ